MNRDVLFLRLLVGQHRMPVRKSASLDILAGYAHVEALLQQRAISQGLSSTKINVFSSFNRLLSLFVDFLDGRVDVETLRN